MRAGFQTREFEERFIAIGLPYKVLGTSSTSAPRSATPSPICALSPSLRTICVRTHRQCSETRLGTASLQAVHVQARSSGKPLMAAAIDLVTTDELRLARATRLADSARISPLARAAAGMHHTDLAKMVLDESGYTGMWQADRSPEAEGRLENLTELVNAMQDFDTLQGFLEHISLVMDGDTDSDQGEVMLMTLHSAKGLEFDTISSPAGKRGLPEPADHRREWRRRPRGRAAARLCRHHPRPQAGASELCRQPPDTRPVAILHSLALCSGTAARDGDRGYRTGLGGGIPFGRASQARLAGGGEFGDVQRGGYGPAGAAWRPGRRPAASPPSPRRAMPEALPLATGCSTRNSAWAMSFMSTATS